MGFVKTGVRMAVALGAFVALAACQSMSRPEVAGKGTDAATVALATPPGVGLKTTRGIRNAAGNLIPGPLAYTNAAGRLLYIYEKDSTPGVSACVGPCLQGYAPLLADKSLKLQGNWGVIAREPGVFQWAFKDNPLYVSTAAQESTTYKMCPVPDRKAGTPEFPDPWCVALFQPAAGIKIPDGFAVQEIPNASGQGLVDADGFTLYAFHGDATRDGQSCVAAPCKIIWKPVEAAALAGPVGDFTILKRADGSPQWAYKGRGLYTYSGDLAAGDAGGLHADVRWTPVMFAAYFTPPEIKMQVAPGFGTIWTDKAGMTLYTQNRAARGRGPSRPVPQVDCDAACMKVWHPFKAADDAQPSGLWTIVTAPDGSRQWAYRGQGLFSYSLDQKPGDMKGEYLYSYYKTDPTGKITNIANGRSAVDVPVSWRPAFPY